MILAGDIGGTNCRLAFFDESGPPLTIEVFPSKGHAGPEEIIGAFVEKHGFPVEAAAFGIAGPVQNGRSITPNLPWVVDAACIAGVLGLKAVDLVNDLEANAQGIAALNPEHFATLNQGSPAAAGNRVLISAGTGLGEAGLIAHGDGYLTYPSEGGHADFAPRNETELELLRYLMGIFDHVSWERVLSGPGLFNIYKFFRDTKRAEEPAWLTEEMRNNDPSRVVSERGLDGSSEICVLSLNTFASIYGAEAGNLALKGMATGGVYLGGGIAPKMLPKLREPLFLDAFWNKGRLRKLLEDIPVHVILNDKTALLGAARIARLARSRTRIAQAL